MRFEDPQIDGWEDREALAAFVRLMACSFDPGQVAVARRRLTARQWWMVENLCRSTVEMDSDGLAG